jgi:D-alanyl-D-alanine carboxypeptidase/D-alanyl-D-alanine-endopeptidase (penicillin-binding protein 4)
MKRIVTLFVLFCCWSVPQTFAVEPAGLADRILRLLNKPDNRKSQFSIHLCDPSTGETVFSHHCQVPLIPASNIKLITSAAALDRLGADFVYETIFGLWNGNLVVIAGGDPLTGDPEVAERLGKDINFIFDKVLQQLHQRNITTVKGDLVIDDTIFDDVRFHPSWPTEQADKWYAAEVSGLNFNDNCVDIYFTPAVRSGLSSSYKLVPNTKYLKITNKCKTVSKGTNKVGAIRSPGGNDVTLIGECRSRLIKPIYVTVDRPSVYFGFVLAEYLLDHGVSIEGKLIVNDLQIKELGSRADSLPKDFDKLFVYRTPIKDVLVECNQRSLNLVAECLFKTLGAYHNCVNGKRLQQGSWETGRAAVEAFLQKLEVPKGQYVIDDGGGLSHSNLVSARCITRVLSYIYKHDSFAIYRDSLATEAVGTLAKKERFHGEKYRGRVFAKTGYVAGVRTLSGYCKTSSGNWLAFSILTNSPPATQGTIDQIVKEMIE